MRKAVFLLCLCSLGAFAQITINSGQTRQTVSTATGNVGSTLLAFGGTVTGWSIVSELNPGGLGPATDAVFFSISNSGQLAIIQSLGAFFSSPATTSVSITLTVRVFDDMGGSDDETVNVIVASGVPVIVVGQTRQIVVTADPNASVGSPVVALNGVTGWTLVSEDNWVSGTVTGVSQTEQFFTINNSGQIQVLQRLDRFFLGLVGREDQLTVRLTLSAINTGGVSASQTIDIILLEGTLPGVVGNQSRNIVDSATPGALGGALQSIGSPTYWRINSGTILSGFDLSGAFSIAATGVLSNSLYLDQFSFPTNPFTITLSVSAGNQFGESAATNISVVVTVVGGRCGLIPATQTRYISSIAIVGDDIGFPVDNHGLDSLWIEEAWLDGSPPDSEVATYFTVETNGGTLGQLVVSRPLALAFDPDQITKVLLRLRGHAIGDQCPNFVDEVISVYVLPSDADPGGGGGGGTSTGPDFSTYIDDPELLACIREHLGLSIGDSLTAAMVTGMTHLDCACRNGSVITDLDGLHLFTGMAELNLSNNLVSDIRPLSGLTDLTDLRLAYNNINDITSSNQLASLANLVYLDLSHNHIRNTNAFTTLTNLHFLSLANNDICDIASIVALTNIGGMATGDVLNIENDSLPVAPNFHGNHLASTAGTQQISQISGHGVQVFSANNNNSCATAHAFVEFQTWPSVTVGDFADAINLNIGACSGP